MWKSDEGKNISYWQTGLDGPETSRLNESAETAVCVIGGGLAGLTTAYLLTKAGIDTVVIDDGVIGGGETARTTAHLSYAIDDRIYRIEKWHGEEHARLAVQSHLGAINEIERIQSSESINCDFSRLDGYLVESEESEDDLNEEIKAAHRLGFARILDADLAIETFAGRRAIKFPDQGQFHVLKYLRGLAAAIEQNGGRIHSHTAASDWSDDDGLTVITATGEIKCSKAIVLATNYALKSKMFAQLPAYRTYAIGARIPKGSMEKLLIWDTGDPYHYVRIQEEDDHDLLIVGGEDHRTGQDDDGGEARHDRLWSWTRRHFPFAEMVEHKWSGQCLETHDGLAFIGRYSSDKPNVFLITGDSGMGMTHGTIGGMLVSDLILGRENPLEKVYDPSRIATQSITEAVPEIIDSTTPYLDWVTGGDISSEEDLKPGEGAVIRDGLTKKAVYRDDDGKLFRHSAVCPHLGCIVRFNASERTWDCPCHGSRFDGVDGHVINSPAMGPLAKIE